MNLVPLIASPGFASQLASRSLLLALLDARFSSREKVLEESGGEKFIASLPCGTFAGSRFSRPLNFPRAKTHVEALISIMACSQANAFERCRQSFKIRSLTGTALNVSIYFGPFRTLLMSTPPGSNWEVPTSIRPVTQTENGTHR